MRDPVGVLRNLFIRLYGVCFDVELYDHGKSHVLLRDCLEVGEREFIFLFSDTGPNLVRDFRLASIPHNFGMMFADPLQATSFRIRDKDGVAIERITRRRYAINTAQVQLAYRRFIRTDDNLARDALAINEVMSVALAAHEIRHELQISGIIPRDRWHQRLPVFRAQRVTETKRYSEKSSRDEFYRYLKQYGRRLIDDREVLAMEIDSHAVQLASSYSWTDTRHLPFEERLKRIRDIIFSGA